MPLRGLLFHLFRFVCILLLLLLLLLLLSASHRCASACREPNFSKWKSVYAPYTFCIFPLWIHNKKQFKAPNLASSFTDVEREGGAATAHPSKLYRAFKGQYRTYKRLYRTLLREHKGMQKDLYSMLKVFTGLTKRNSEGHVNCF